MKRFAFAVALCLAMACAAWLAVAADEPRVLALLATDSMLRPDGPPLAAGQTATLMPDGRWLVLGGFGAEGPHARASLWDPRANAATPLSARLAHGRAWHTATLLPDGSVLVTGGLGVDGVVDVVERFTVESGSAVVPAPNATPRLRHTATLMTDGSVLVVGGLDDAAVALATAERWQVTRAGVVVTRLRLVGPRSDHEATLAADGSVLVTGGVDADGRPREDVERFDPAALTFAPVAMEAVGIDGIVELAASLPEGGAANVPVDAIIALRFTAPSPHAALDSLVLTGPEGVRAIRLVPAEDGRLLFIAPLAPLSPGATYVLAPTPESDTAGPLARMARLVFSTAAVAVGGAHSDLEGPVAPSSEASATPHSAGRLDAEASAPTGGAVEADRAATALRSAPHSFVDPPPPAAAPTPGGDAWDGDGVDLSTGIFVHRATDLFVDSAPPLALTRTYRSGDTSVRPFGIGTSHPYQIFVSLAPPYQEARLVLEDGTALRFARTTPGTDLASAVFRHTDTPTAYFGATLAGPSSLRLIRADGTLLDLGENAPLQRIDSDYDRVTEVIRHGFELGPRHGVIEMVRSQAERWVIFGYDAQDRIVQARDTLGRIVNYAYDAAGRLVSFTDPDGGITRYTYDGAHRMLTIRDPRGVLALQNEYDGVGRVVRQVLADGAEYRFAYTAGPDGRVTRTDVTGPRGQVRRVVFDARGYRASDTRAAGTPIAQTTLYERDAAGFVSATTDALGRRTTFARDAMGRVTEVTRLAGTSDAATTRLAYVPTAGLGIGRLSGVADPLGRTTSIAYGPDRFPASVVDPSGQIARLAGSSGYLLQVGDAIGETTVFRDPLTDDITELIDPIGRATIFDRDGGGRLLSRTDPAGRRASYAYDRFDRVARITDGRGGTTAFAYDSVGNLATVTDPRGKATTFTYDRVGRVVGRVDPLGRAEQRTYDASGNLASTTDRKGQVTARSYDALDRLLGITYADGSTATYEWDAGNRLVRVVDSASGTIERTWDMSDRLVSETTAEGTVTSTYDAAGRRTAMTSAGAPTTYEYDAAGRVTSIGRGAVSIGATYDAAGRRTSLALPGGITVDYAYDAASQLTGLTYRRSGQPLGTLTYGYDRAGRRIRVGGSWARVALPPASTAAYDDADRVLAFGGAAASHDANGNLTSDGARSYTWNARDQLVAVDGPGVAWRFAYDALGRRWEVSVGGVATRFLLDGFSVAAIIHPDGEAPVLHGPDGDEPLVVGQPGDLRVLLADGIGSVLAIADDVGAISSTFTYQPFGARSDAGSPGGFRFTGREDDGAGLSFHRARYYHPALQRYLSENPAGVVAGHANRYAYARHEPLGRVDPLGLDADSRPRPAANLALDAADPIAGSPRPARALQVPGISAADSMMVERVIGRSLSPESARAVEAIDVADGGAAPCPSTPPLAPRSDVQARTAWLRLSAVRCAAR